MQHFITSEDFLPPSQSRGEFENYVMKWLLNEDGPLVSERAYVARFLKCVNAGEVKLNDIQTFMIGIDQPSRRDISAAMPLTLLTHYRGALDAVVTNPDRVNGGICKSLFSRIKGKVFKVPTTKDGIQIVDRIAAVDHYAALEYAYWLLLSKYKSDLCKCGFCKKYFLAESKGLGRTSRTFCDAKHMKKHRAATSAERTQAGRAGVTCSRWRQIQADHPGITPGKWEKIEQHRASRKAT